MFRVPAGTILHSADPNDLAGMMRAVERAAAGGFSNPWVWLGQIDVELPGGERLWHHVIRLHRARATLEWR